MWPLEMYQEFFGFRERPFRLTPNPRFLFLNPGHREALATLRYGLSSSLGITLLIGEAGTGKTTLLRAALDAEQRPEHRYAVLNNPTLAPADFFEILAATFGLPDAAGSKGRFLLAFEDDLVRRHAAGGLVAVVVDEAQSLTHELFEEIRLLANLETPTAKLVNVVLVGQPELSDRLNDPSLRQLKQRIVLRCSLFPLDLESTGAYIALRLRVAGAAPGNVFTRDAVHTIYEASRGIPRVIGVVCENALLAGYAAQKKPIDQPIVAAVCGDLDLLVDEGNARRNGAVKDQDGAGAGHTAETEPGGQASSRSWFALGRSESTFDSSSEPRPAAGGWRRPRAFPGRRIFRFF